MSHPLNQSHVNPKIDSCLAVARWDPCPQQIYLILLHGHLAAYSYSHMVRWHYDCSLVECVIPQGCRHQLLACCFETNLPLCQCEMPYIISVIIENISKLTRKTEMSQIFRTLFSNSNNFLKITFPMYM